MPNGLGHMNHVDWQTPIPNFKGSSYLRRDLKCKGKEGPYALP
jgi:hypothetical protein